MPAIRILILDYRALISRGISTLLQGFPDLDVIGQAQSTPEALKLLEIETADVVVLDVDLPGPSGGLEAIAAIRRAAPYARLVVLTNLQDPGTIHSALRMGATGYLLKNVSVEELADAIRAAYRGVPALSSEVTGVLVKRAMLPEQLPASLTSREQQVLDLMSRGLNNQQIASQLSISQSTVQFHVSNILAKLGAHNRTEAATFALRQRFGQS
jgi:DNA-binding NarL/FixJ family response regulator